MLALWESLGHSGGAAEEFPLGAVESLPAIEPAMATAFEESLTRLRTAGLAVRPVHIAEMLAGLSGASDTVMHYEGARFHEQRFVEHGARLADLAVLVAEGRRIPRHRYDEARRSIDACRLRMAELYKATPVIVLPAATGAAPRGLASTGDPRMNAPWTALGTPAISIPMPAGGGLPLGLQLTAAPGRDARVLRTAVELERVLGV
jgi:Asp-tRNA(Asn)/Glu-tRNA(Gln) amidotransferase A subunit family amidase